MRSWTSPSCETRRRVLLGGFLLAVPLLSPGSPALAQGAVPQRFSRVVIDTSPLAASGASQLGENIKPMLTPGVVEAMGGLVDPRDRGAPVLVISIKSLDLPSYSGGDNSDPHFRFGGAGSSMDSLDTVVTVVSGRKVLSTFPLLVSQPSSAGGSWFLPNNEDRRVQALGRSLGGWIRKKVAA